MNKHWIDLHDARGPLAWMELGNGQKTCISIHQLGRCLAYEWFDKFHKGKYYAAARYFLNGKQHTLYLHNFVTNLDKGDGRPPVELSVEQLKALEI